MKNNYKTLHKYFKALAIGFVLSSILNTQVNAQCPSISSTNGTPTGCGSGTGTVTVNASGGIGTLTYLWNPGGKSGSTITGLTVGTYTVTVTDANGCSVTGAATVSPPSGGPIISIDNQKNLKCNGDKNGNVYTSATGGTGNYNYVWSTGVSGSGISSNISNIGAGIYTVTYTDKVSSCSSQKSIVITEPAAFNMAPVLTNIKCKGAVNGSISITPTGNTGPYVYNWAPVNKQTEDLTGLQAGTYTLSITDSQGCTAVFSYTLGEPATTVLVSTSSTTTNCGSNTGTATANVSGGTGVYTYSWNNGSKTSSISSLGVGSYTVIVTDNNGCTNTSVATVSNPNGPIAIIISQTDATCGKNDGTAVVSSVSGTTPYTYSWTNGSTGSTITNLASGSYTVTVVDGKDCSATTSVSINCVTGINELNPDVSFSMYPNPATSNITIETTTNKPYTIKLLNLLGEIIYSTQASVNKINIDVGILPKGIYIVQVQDTQNNVSGRQRLVLQ